MDISTFWSTIKVLFALANIAAAIIFLIRMYIWTRYNPAKSSQTDYALVFIIKFGFLFVETWFRVLFFFLFASSAYWFIFYKLQSEVFVLIPPSSDSSSYIGWYVTFWLLVIASLLSMIALIFRQSRNDYFLIDWEKNEDGPPAVWRTIYIANEFAEIQTQRYITIEFLLIGFALLMEGFNLEYLDMEIPYFILQKNQNSTVNNVLHFAISCSIFFVLGIANYVFRLGISLWYPTATQQFIDLCSVSNISVLILDEMQHGYYIHGCAPSGKAEKSLESLRSALELEAKGTSRSRGLVANDSTHLQTFEIFIPANLRSQYDGIFNFNVDSHIDEMKRKEAYSGGLGIDCWPGNVFPKNIDLVTLERNKVVVMTYLKAYLEEVSADNEKLVLDKPWWFRFFQYPPRDLEKFSTGNPEFYKDPGQSFESTMFFGYDMFILFFDMTFYNAVFVITQNTLISLLITYIVQRAFEGLRRYYGIRNLSRKTLIDDRFLKD